MDRQLRERTVYNHVREIERLLGCMGSDSMSLGRGDLRSYLGGFQGRPANTYSNVLKSLKVFFRDFLGRPELVASFRFPHVPVKPKILSFTTEDLRVFYDELGDSLAEGLFLVYATSGLRRNEVLGLRGRNVDSGLRMIVPEGSSRTKSTYVTFYNEEASELLKEIIPVDSGARIFPVTENYFRKRYIRIRAKTGIHVTPQMLREWFCSEMGRLGVPDRYVDAFCGRVPASVLAKHYTDFSPENLKEIYDKASLKVLS